MSSPLNSIENQRSALRVLVVEDDLLIAMELEDMLAGFGCEVVGPFARLGDAIAATDGELDGAVIDLNVRGEYSYPLIERLRQRSVPMIICSGYVDLPTIGEKVGDVPMLAKPCSPEKLSALIRTHFTARHRTYDPAAN